MPHGSGSGSHGIMSNGSSIADHEDIGRVGRTFEHAPRPENGRPPIQPENELENELERMVSIFQEQSAKLEVAFQEIKATTNYFLDASRGSPGALALEVGNSEAGQRIKIKNKGFVRLNTWLEASMDVLEQYLSPDGVEDEVSEFDEGEEGLDGSDLNKRLFLMGCEGYKVLIGEVRYLMSTTSEEKDETTPLSNEASLTEELLRFLNWGSYTGIKEGQLMILINDPLYKDIRDVLERIIVTLITLSEECFIKQPSFIASSLDNESAGDGTRLSPWLEQAKKYLGRLPNKSFSTQTYFDSSAVPLNGDISTPTESRKGEERGREPSNLDTIQEHSYSNSGPLESSKGESQNKTDGVSDLRPTLSPIASASSQGSLVDHLLGELKDCNNTLSPLSGVLEMAKARLGKGTQSELYQAIRNNQPDPPLSNQYRHHTPSAPTPPLLASPLRTPPLPTPPLPASPPPPIPSPSKPPLPPPKAPKPRLRFENDRPKPRQKFSDVIEEAETQRTSQSLQAILCDQIQAAALTNTETLPFLLSDLEDIGFGLYCERKAVLLGGLGLNKWVELEILKAMWNSDSKITRDSFRELSKKNLLDLRNLAPKAQPPNPGPNRQNNYGSGNNATQQPPTSFEGHNTTQQPPRFGNGPSAAYQPPVNFASLNPICVSGQYTATYYPQTTETIRNGTYEVVTQAPNLRRSSNAVDLAQARPGQPLIAAVAYNNNSVPGLSYNASISRPSKQPANRPHHHHSPEIIEPRLRHQQRPLSPITVSGVVDLLDKNTDGRRDASPPGPYIPSSSSRFTNIDRKRDTSPPVIYTEPSSPVSRPSYSIDRQYPPNRQRGRDRA